jgi:AraC-like DNA-binding protein
MAQFNVTELDFDKIKANIKEHFKLQSKYNDWNFEGSGLSVLLDVLAYNTHYNAMLAHFSMNETFLDTAQIRGNVVSHAKLLGYTPRSTLATTAKVRVVVSPSNLLNAPAELQLNRGTRFTSIIDSTKYNFVNLEPLTTARNSDNKYVFDEVTLKEGTLKRMLYRVDTSLPSQKFEIPDTNIDTTTLRVRLKANETSNDYTIYTKFSTLLNIGPESLIYFIQENAAGKYEIYFGDDTLGNRPQSNQIVEVEYIYTSGDAANNGSVVNAYDNVGAYGTFQGYSKEYVATTLLAATPLTYGGAQRESIESIKFNAPITFVSQNRAVTADDYRAIILKEFGGISSISVWGGEDSIIPNYGKVFISVKPNGPDGTVLNEVQRTQIISTILKGKNVVSITPVIVDPEYSYLKLEVFFKYNPNLTDRTKIELQSLVRQTISDYNDDNLNKFDGVFRYSQLSKNIDSADPSILNSLIRVYMYRDFTPVVGKLNSVTLDFSAPIYKSSTSEEVIESTSFLQNGIEYYFSDSPTTNTDPTKRVEYGDRTVYIYRLVSGNKIRIRDAGKIYLSEGRVIIDNFIPDSATPIRITATPNSNDLAPKRNQLLQVSMAATSVTGEIDTIAVAGTAGAINYTTTSRHR